MYLSKLKEVFFIPPVITLQLLRERVQVVRLQGWIGMCYIEK